MRSLSLALIAAGSMAAVEAHGATEVRIGTAASAKNEVTGTLGAARRVLKLGDGVFQNESIATGNAASAQILFADETALTMGPNSRVILDKLIYEPNKRTGELAIRATTGAFRFVTGSGPKQGYKINTAVGTIGVRGTIIEFWIIGPRLTLALTEGGTYFCSPSQKCIELTQPGTYVIVNATQIGDVKSKQAQACESGPIAGCVIGDDNLYIQFLGLGRFLNDLSPASGPNNPPPNNPQPGNGPPAQTGFPPIQTGAGTVPPGLQSHTPPGLERNRSNPGNLPPGLAKK